MDDPTVQKARKTLVILALVVIVLLTVLCAGIFIAFSRFSAGSLFDNAPAESDTTPTPVVGLTPTPVEETRIWMPYVERFYLFKVEYLSTWEIRHDTPRGDSVAFVAEDGSELGISSQRSNHRFIEDFLRALDIRRSTENDGSPSFLVEWTVDFDVAGDTVIRRRERNLLTEETLVKAYLLKEKDVFVFTVYSPDEESIETNEMFRETFNVVGSFQYKLHRFEAEGRVVRGSDIGRTHCMNGLYLDVAGSFVNPRDSFLLLRYITPNRGEPYPMFTNQTYVGSNVTIDAVYDTEKFLCGEFTCDCEDYLLVENIVKR